LKKLFGNNAEVEHVVLYAILIRVGINIQFQDAALLCILSAIVVKGQVTGI